MRELQGGTSNTGFSYRIVARRKDVSGERFAKIDITPPMQVGKPATVRGRKAAPSAASSPLLRSKRARG